MNYRQTLDYLYGKLPMFSRIGASAIKKDLHHIQSLCHLLDEPHTQFSSIHIGGTNGKGSTSHMLAAIFQKAGYKTGLYTSPHLKDFRERIRINGKMIPRKDVISFVSRLHSSIEEIQPSFFEVTVAMAFDFFARQKVDMAIIEVGLGGRLDSTNIIHPQLSVITNISLDHVQLLGDTLAAIASEKAGIIKENTPVIIGEHHPETAPVFTQKAASVNAPLQYASPPFKILSSHREDNFFSMDVKNEDTKEVIKNLQLDLTGNYQRKNLLTVCAAVEVLRKQGYHLPEKSVRQGLRNVKKLTGLKGRWYTVSKDPLIICDTGHNEAGIREVITHLSEVSYQRLHLVLGMVKDKEVAKVLSLLPSEAHYYFCAPALERALPAIELQEAANRTGLKGVAYPDVPSALQAAKVAYLPGDLIFVGGSTFVVAEILS